VKWKAVGYWSTDGIPADGVRVKGGEGKGGGKGGMMDKELRDVADRCAV
jgi:hypothetical protein